MSAYVCHLLLAFHIASGESIGEAKLSGQGGRAVRVPMVEGREVTQHVSFESHFHNVAWNSSLNASRSMPRLAGRVGGGWALREA